MALLDFLQGKQEKFTIKDLTELLIGNEIKEEYREEILNSTEHPEQGIIKLSHKDWKIITGSGEQPFLVYSLEDNIMIVDTNRVGFTINQFFQEALEKRLELEYGTPHRTYLVIGGLMNNTGIEEFHQFEYRKNVEWGRAERRKLLHETELEITRKYAKPMYQLFLERLNEKGEYERVEKECLREAKLAFISNTPLKQPLFNLNTGRNFDFFHIRTEKFERYFEIMSDQESYVAELVQQAEGNPEEVFEYELHYTCKEFLINDLYQEHKDSFEKDLALLAAKEIHDVVMPKITDKIKVTLKDGEVLEISKEQCIQGQSWMWHSGTGHSHRRVYLDQIETIQAGRKKIFSFELFKAINTSSLFALSPKTQTVEKNETLVVEEEGNSLFKVETIPASTESVTKAIEYVSSIVPVETKSKPNTIKSILVEGAGNISNCKKLCEGQLALNL